jgi:hypothetical protein
VKLRPVPVAIALKECVDERRDRRTLGKNDESRKADQHQDDRCKPPPFVLPEELQKLSCNPHPALKILEEIHMLILTRSEDLCFFLFDQKVFQDQRVHAAG